MIVERSMIHDIVELIPESEMAKVYAILNAYMLHDGEDVLTEVEEARMQEGFEQITQGGYISVNDYMKKRMLKA